MTDLLYCSVKICLNYVVNQEVNHIINQEVNQDEVNQDGANLIDVQNPGIK